MRPPVQIVSALPAFTEGKEYVWVYSSATLLPLPPLKGRKVVLCKPYPSLWLGPGRGFFYPVCHP